MSAPEGAGPDAGRSLRDIVLTVAVVLGCMATYSLAALFLWHPVAVAWHNDYHLSDMIKGWYPNDQFSYLTITSNVSHGVQAYREPIMLNGSSIYPSGYYWFLGMIGRVTGLNPFALWNIVGLIMTFALMLAAGWWGRHLSGRKWGWLLGPLPVMIGTLQWWFDGNWKHEYPGVQAVQWPPYAILFNPGAEQATLTLAIVALFLTYKSLRTDGSISPRWALACGAVIGLMLNAHSYVPLLTLATITTIFLLSQVLVDGTRREAILSAISSVAGVGVAALHIPSMPLGRFVMVVIGLLLPLALVSRWRRRVAVAIIGFYIAAVVFFLPLLLRLGAQALQEGSYLQLRQHIYDGLDFSIPMTDVFVQALPVLAMATAAVVFLWRRRADEPRTTQWIAVIAATTGMTLLMEWNAHWGFQQEAYRFFPYQLVLLCAVGAPWLLTRWRSNTEIITRVVVVCLILATIPTTKTFYEYTKSRIMLFSPEETQTYRQIGRHLPNDGGAVLTDVCMPPKTFKISADVKHAAVTDIVGGLALPDEHENVTNVLKKFSTGTLPSNDELRSAGITSFLSMNYCNGPTVKQLQERFGNPIAAIPMVRPEVCNMPADMTYRLYRVGDNGSTSTPFPSLESVGNAFRQTPGYQMPPVNVPCSLVAP